MPPSHTTWLAHPAIPGSLGQQDIHVWLLDLSEDSIQRHQQGVHLQAADAAYADSIASPGNRKRFIATRNIYREILGSYLQIPAAEITIDRDEHGKPFIVSPGHIHLNFNISHSHDRGLLALSQSASVGVDLEHSHRNIDAIKLARRFFSPAESGWLEALEQHQLNNAFLSIWTRKEAILKCHGMGISFGLDRFDCMPGTSVIRLESQAQQTTAYYLYELPAIDNYHAALATTLENAAVSYFIHA
jgi:4'-phosphopantetheinyl transferase